MFYLYFIISQEGLVFTEALTIPAKQLCVLPLWIHNIIAVVPISNGQMLCLTGQKTISDETESRIYFFVAVGGGSFIFLLNKRIMLVYSRGLSGPNVM